MDTIQIIIFQLYNYEFGIDIFDVKEIVTAEQVQEVPNTPDYIKGIINLRGSVVPIIDLKLRFKYGTSDITDSSRYIIVEVEDIEAGFIVDEVKEILKVENVAVEEAPKLIGGIKRKYIRGVVKLDDRMVIILDLAKILTAEETEELVELVNVNK